MDREKGMLGEPGAALAQAEEALVAASDALQAEQRRLQATREEIAALTEQVKCTDPDDGKAFARLVQARDAARGREEALVVRVEAAAAKRAELDEVAAGARREKLKVDVAQARAQLLADGEEATKVVRREAAKLLDRLREHQALAGRVREVQRKLDLVEGRTHVAPQVPGTPWNALPVNDPATALVAAGEQLGRILAWEAGAPGRLAMAAAEERQRQAQAAQRADTFPQVSEGPARAELEEGLEIHRKLEGEHLSQTVRVPQDYDPLARQPRAGDYNPLAAGRS